MLQLMQLFYDRDRMLRYTDDLGHAFVWTWNASDIAVETDISVTLTPRENLARQERFNRALQVFTLAAPVPGADQYELLHFIFREMGLRDDEIRKLVKSPQEIAAESAALQAAQAAPLSTQPQAGVPGLGIRQPRSAQSPAPEG